MAHTFAARQNLSPLLQAGSVAIVGISRPERFGGLVYTNLRNFGYRGPIYGVNPGYASLFDQPCYPSLSDLPERPDCAILAVPNQRLREAMGQAAALNIPAAVIFASAYAAPAPGEPSLQSRLAEVALAHNMAVCGPNCMGFVAPGARLAVSGYPTNPHTPAGNVTFITHSGSVWEAFLQNKRGVAFNYIISAGNEMSTSMADYIQFTLTDPTTHVIGLFLETVRDPQTFTAALSEAAARDIPVVILKVGRSERGAQLAQAHSGALAGEDAVYDALFAYYGVRRAKSPDELLDTLELFATGIRPPTRSVAALLDSGGQRGMLVDLAEQEGIEFAPLSPPTEQRLAAVLEPGLDPVNPLDAWGTGNDFDHIYRESLLALDSDPAVGLTLFAVDLYPTDDHSPLSYPEIVAAVQSRLQKPLAMLTHLSAALSETQAGQFRRLGIPVLQGTETGLRAVRHLLEYSAFQRRRARQSGPPRLVSRPDSLPELRRMLAQATGPLGEHASKQILQAYGLDTPAEQVAGSLAEALQAADRIGYPVALKTATGLAHKSEQAGVYLDLRETHAVSAAYRDLAARLGSHVLVQQMVPPGVELILGLATDPQFGPLLALGSGGIFVEILRDTCLLLLPTDAATIRAALLSLRGAALLPGARGQPPVDVEAVVNAALGVAALSEDLGDLIAALDLNPLIALPEGAVVVDALIVPKASN